MVFNPLRQSNHVHAGAFHFVEQGEAEKDDYDAYHHAGTDLPEVDGSLAHKCKAEGFDDENHGVQGKQPSKVLRHRTERIGHALVYIQSCIKKPSMICRSRKRWI